MNVEHADGSRIEYGNLTDEEVLEKTEKALKDEDVVKIEIQPNRHERRRSAALARKAETRKRLEQRQG